MDRHHDVVVFGGLTARQRESPAPRAGLARPSAGVKLDEVRKGNPMARLRIALLLIALGSLTTGCVAPILAGGTAVLIADEISEQEQGGDGLF